ncbi:MAG: LuxR C-terminal-related transcriptional regulator [Terracidiphilus sp.]
MCAAAAIEMNTGRMPSPINAACGDLKSQTISHTEAMVFIVDEDIDIRKSLELLVRSQGWQPEACCSAREFLAHPRVFVPCALILAFSSSGPNGLEVQKRIAGDYAAMPIIVVADYEDVSTAVQSMKAGAIDFLLKPFCQELMVATIRQGIARSRVVLDRGMEMRDLRSRHASLSPRERQVMALVVSGLLNKQVGGELGISEITVKAHRGQVMQKMKATSLVHLVNMALKLRITSSTALCVSYA